MTEAHEPLKQAAKSLPEIKEEDRAQIELARQREAAGEVKPFVPPKEKKL